MNRLKTTLIAFGFILLSLAGVAESEILFRSTFGVKDAGSINPWDVESRSYDNWASNSSMVGLIQAREENTDIYQTRMHGRYSLYINDPDTTISYAYAVSPTFANTADEYMIEFWFYVPEGGVGFYHSYPICVPLNINGTDTNTTDAQLWVTPIKDPAYLQLTVINNNDTLSAGTIDSLNRWYKLQLHRRNDSVDVYLMSVLKATIKAESDLKVNALRIGTNKKNLAGEAYWDDFIVTTVPNGVHPRLYFNSSELANLRLRTQDNTPTVLGKSYAQIFNEDIRNQASGWVANPSSANFSTYGAVFIYPFYQPAPSSPNTWIMSAQYSIPARIEQVAVAAVATDSTRYYDWLKPVLIAYSTWQQWSNPEFRTLYPYAIPHEAGLFTQTISMAYDMVFTHLNNYEKMNAQNGIITLGLQQLDYQIVQPQEGPDFFTDCKGGLGIGAMVMDPPITEYLNASKEIMEQKVMFNPLKCDPLGKGIQNGHYEYCTMASIVKWTEAVTHSNLTLPDYYATCPFLMNYNAARCEWYSLRNVSPYIIEPTFYHCYGISYDDPSSMYLLSGKYKNSYSQYLVAKWPWPSNFEFILT